MEEENNKKTNKGLIATVIILVLVIIGLCVYIAYDKGIIFKSNTNVEEKKEIKKFFTEKNIIEVENATSGLYNKYVTNAQFINYSFPFNVSVDAKVNSDKKSVNLTIYWALLSEEPRYYFGERSTDIEEKTIKLDKKIKDVFVGGSSQYLIEMILYLMEDGTVEYTPIAEAVSDNSRSYGPLPNVTNVEKIISADVRKSDTTSWTTTIGIRSDGDFYDLEDIFKQVKNVNN